MEVEEIDLSALDLKDNDRKRTHSDALPLDIDCNDNEDETPVRRSNRKKIRPMEVTEKRRVVTRPRKLSVSSAKMTSSTKEVEHYYTDKKIKLSSPALETIFEEPRADIIMSNRRLRRCIQFSEVGSEKPDKNKVRKRSMKAKKIIKGGLKKIGRKLGLEVLMNKLKDLDDIEETPH